MTERGSRQAPRTGERLDADGRRHADAGDASVMGRRASAALDRAAGLTAAARRFGRLASSRTAPLPSTAPHCRRAPDRLGPLTARRRRPRAARRAPDPLRPGRPAAAAPTGAVPGPPGPEPAADRPAGRCALGPPGRRPGRPARRRPRRGCDVRSAGRGARCAVHARRRRRRARPGHAGRRGDRRRATSTSAHGRLRPRTTGGLRPARPTRPPTSPALLGRAASLAPGHRPRAPAREEARSAMASERAALSGPVPRRPPRRAAGPPPPPTPRRSPARPSGRAPHGRRPPPRPRPRRRLHAAPRPTATPPPPHPAADRPRRAAPRPGRRPDAPAAHRVRAGG